MNPNIQLVANLARDLMDGQQPPPAGPKLDPYGKAIHELQKHKSAAEYELLGKVLLGVLIDRVGSDIQAQQTLQSFIRGDHA